MRHIKEPKGVDFIIKSRPLTKEEELLISEHIKTYKLKNKGALSKRKKIVRKNKAAIA